MPVHIAVVQRGHVGETDFFPGKLGADDHGGIAGRTRGHRFRGEGGRGEEGDVLVARAKVEPVNDVGHGDGGGIVGVNFPDVADGLGRGLGFGEPELEAFDAAGVKRDAVLAASGGFLSAQADVEDDAGIVRGKLGGAEEANGGIVGIRLIACDRQGLVEKVGKDAALRGDRPRGDEARSSVPGGDNQGVEESGTGSGDSEDEGGESGERVGWEGNGADHGEVWGSVEKFAGAHSGESPVCQSL